MQMLILQIAEQSDSIPRIWRTLQSLFYVDDYRYRYRPHRHHYFERAIFRNINGHELINLQYEKTSRYRLIFVNRYFFDYVLSEVS